MDENKSLWSKNLDELTVGDALKLNLAAAGFTVAIGVFIAGAGIAGGKFSDWRHDRQIRKANIRNN